jgi:hypothetical protein
MLQHEPQPIAEFRTAESVGYHHDRLKQAERHRLDRDGRDEQFRSTTFFGDKSLPQLLDVSAGRTSGSNHADKRDDS